jgi:4-methylaminobutanoate oxidase (formaldehyde-forming)
MLEPTTDLLPDGEGLTPAWVDGGEWTVEVADRLVPATVSLRPLYDPSNARIKA